MNSIRKKLGNEKQLRGIYDIEFKSNRERGKCGLLIYNDRLEIFINTTNALDIVWVRYKGVNLSFLSKNGLNSITQPFENAFEGGFLYTCGLDNVSTCVKGAPIHGSLHHRPAENISYSQEGDNILIKGEIYFSALFKENLILRRSILVGKNFLRLNDRIINDSCHKAEYALLYHTNFGYPLLDIGDTIRADIIDAEGLTEKAERNKRQIFSVLEAEDNEIEDVYYCKLKSGNIEIINKKLNIKVGMTYDNEVLPEFLLWKSMNSGDYALGFEPSVTRFHPLKMKEIEKDEVHEYGLEFTFSEISG